MPRPKSLFYEHNFFIDYFSLALSDFIDSMYSMYSIDFIDFIDSMKFLCLYQEKPRCVNPNIRNAGDNVL